MINHLTAEPSDKYLDTKCPICGLIIARCDGISCSNCKLNDKNNECTIIIKYKNIYQHFCNCNFRDSFMFYFIEYQILKSENELLRLEKRLYESNKM